MKRGALYGSGAALMAVLALLSLLGAPWELLIIPSVVGTSLIVAGVVVGLRGVPA